MSEWGGESWGLGGWQGLIREGFVEELDLRWVLKGGGRIPDIAVERKAARSPAPGKGRQEGVLSWSSRCEALPRTKQQRGQNRPDSFVIIVTSGTDEVGPGIGSGLSSWSAELPWDT